MKETANRPTLTKWVVWAMIAGYVLIAHGCHGGDHDTELFHRMWEWCIR